MFERDGRKFLEAIINQGSVSDLGLLLSLLRQAYSSRMSYENCEWEFGLSSDHILGSG